MPNATAAICPNGSHMALWDDQAIYFRHLLAFMGFGTFSLSWAVYRASISDGRERSCAPELLFRNACRLEIMRIAVFGVDPPYSFYLAAASATTFRELAAFSF
jgi:hypothetical protein